MRNVHGGFKILRSSGRQCVPIQDFTSKSDIDWSKGVGEIDRQLYAKYKLTSDEVGFIESMIKPMEGGERGRERWLDDAIVQFGAPYCINSYLLLQ